MADTLLTREFIGRLETVRLASRRRFAGAAQGMRDGLHRGTSLEFSDFRDYTPGDDLRYVDWNIYGRTGRPFVRTFVEEEDLFVHLLVDTSASMTTGEPDKLAWARRLAAALAYIGLVGLDRVAVAAVDGGVRAALRPQRGRSALFAVLDFLAGLPAGGTTTDLGAALAAHARQVTRPGVAVVISDFLTPTWADGLKQLAGRRYEVHAVQVLSPQDLAPSLDGELLLVDAETGEHRPVSVTPAVVDRYETVVQDFVAEIRQWCHRRGLSHTLVSTATPVEDVVLGPLKRAGVVA